MSGQSEYCAKCGHPIIHGYIVTRKGYFSEHTGKPLEERVSGEVCGQISGKYRYDGIDGHTGWEMVKGKWSESEVEA